MVAQAPDRRAGRLAGAAGIAALLIGLALLLEPASWRGAAAALLAAGLAAGVVVALRVPASGRVRSPMERLNDAAFLVVVAAVALIAVRLARPYTAALPGLVGGVLIGLALRPAPRPDVGPGPGREPGPRRGPGPGFGPEPGPDPDPGPGPAATPPPGPGRAGTPPPGAGAPEQGG
jgi:hypothetical protein